MTDQKHSDGSTPVLKLSLPDLRIPSRNEVDKMHWRLKTQIRRAWSIYLVRCMYGLFGTYQTDATNKTMTIRRGAARAFVTQSPSSSAAKVILRKTGLAGNTPQ